MTDIEPISDTRLAEYAEWEAAIAEATEENWLMGSLARAALDEALRQDGLALLARLRKAEAERDRYKAALDWADVARTWIRDGTCACCAACPFCGYDQVKSPGTHDRDCPLPKWDAARATLKEPTHG